MKSDCRMSIIEILAYLAVTYSRATYRILMKHS